MSRLPLAAILALGAPAAGAWVPCNSPAITAPVPVRREAPAYPPAVREIGLEGTVEVALTVLADGTVGWVRVLRADPPGYFEQAAIAGVRAWRFKPARDGGRAIECRMLTRVRFTRVDTVDAPRVTSKSSSRPAAPAGSGRSATGDRREVRSRAFPGTTNAPPRAAGSDAACPEAASTG